MQDWVFRLGPCPNAYCYHFLIKVSKAKVRKFDQAANFYAQKQEVLLVQGKRKCQQQIVIPPV